MKYLMAAFVLTASLCVLSGCHRHILVPAAAFVAGAAVVAA